MTSKKNGHRVNMVRKALTFMCFLNYCIVYDCIVILQRDEAGLMCQTSMLVAGHPTDRYSMF